MNSACTWWVLARQIVSVLSINSTQIHWVNAPSPPVWFAIDRRKLPGTWRVWNGRSSFNQSTELRDWQPTSEVTWFWTCQGTSPQPLAWVLSLFHLVLCSIDLLPPSLWSLPRDLSFPEVWTTLQSCRTGWILLRLGAGTWTAFPGLCHSCQDWWCRTFCHNLTGGRGGHTLQANWGFFESF